MDRARGVPNRTPHGRRPVLLPPGAEGSGKVRQMDGSAGLTGPVEGPPGIIMTGFDLGRVGYTLEEFFLESTATCYEPAGPTGADGYWQVTPAGQAPFATRLVVGRPSDPGATSPAADQPRPTGFASSETPSAPCRTPPSATAPP